MATVQPPPPTGLLTYEQQIAALRERLDPRHVRRRCSRCDVFSSWGNRKCRSPKGPNDCNNALSYLPAWHVIAELNAIFGPGGWSHEVTELRGSAGRKQKTFTKDGKTVTKTQTWAEATVTVQLTVVFANGHQSKHAGVGSGTGTNYHDDVGDAKQGAAKEAESDAIKRAARCLGSRFGLSLYDKDNPILRGGLDRHGEPGVHERLVGIAGALVGSGVSGDAVDEVVGRFSGGVLGVDGIYEIPRAMADQAEQALQVLWSQRPANQQPQQAAGGAR